MAKRVLLIEDEPNIIEAISFILSRDGWTVHTHADGTTALERVRSLPPDMIILDVMLPGLSGFDILRGLRAEPDLRELPVMMLTARGHSKDRELARALGADHFMTKPFSNAEVLEHVRRLAGGAQAKGLNGTAPAGSGGSGGGGIGSGGSSGGGGRGPGPEREGPAEPRPDSASRPGEGA